MIVKLSANSSFLYHSFIDRWFILFWLTTLISDYSFLIQSRTLTFPLTAFSSTSLAYPNRQPYYPCLLELLWSKMDQLNTSPATSWRLSDDPGGCKVTGTCRGTGQRGHFCPGLTRAEPCGFHDGIQEGCTPLEITCYLFLEFSIWHFQTTVDCE